MLENAYKIIEEEDIIQACLYFDQVINHFNDCCDDSSCSICQEELDF